jgi:uncharacterized phage protein (TIGR02216 family)
MDSDVGAPPWAGTPGGVAEAGTRDMRAPGGPDRTKAPRTEATRFDWPGLMRAGMVGLHLRPAEFWALTPAELLLMLGEGGRPAMGRARLMELAARWPDAPRKGEGDGGLSGAR